LPPGLTIDPNSGEISGTITVGASAASPYTVVIGVSDGVTTPVEITFSWNVTTPQSPEVTQPEDQEDNEGDTITPLPIVANDPNDDDLTYAATDLPTGLSIDPDTGIISGTVAYTAAEGSSTKIYSVTVTVTDDSPEANETSVVFSWTINRVNVPPEVQNPGDQESEEGWDISLQIDAVDPNGDPLTYSNVATDLLPLNLSIDLNSGLISGKIDAGASAASPYTVVIGVSDGEAAPVEVTFTWTVLVKSEVNKIYLPIITK
jgi:hypothetical protein